MELFHFILLLLLLRPGLLAETQGEASKEHLNSNEHESRGRHVSSEGVPPLAGGGRDEGRKLSVLLVASMFIGHLFPLTALGEELVRRGHKVAMLGPVMEGTTFPLPQLPESVGIEFIETAKIRQDGIRQMSKLGGNITSFLHMLFRAWEMLDMLRNVTQNTPAATRRVLEKLNSSEWDYVVVDVVIASVLDTVFQIWGPYNSMVNYSPLPLMVPLPPWPFPVVMSPFTENMSFLERLVNSLILYPMHEAGGLFYVYMMQMMDPESDTSEMGDAIAGLKIPVLLNTVIGFEYPKTILPLQHYVGPMFLKKQPPLAPDLGDWLEGRPDQSVVYISMGSTAELTPLQARALLEGVVAETNYSVVWALRESNRYVLEGVDLDPERVFLAGWVAQFALLQHPSIAIAILHCGIGGVQEALYHRIPAICLPYGFDQFDTAARLQSQGLGIRLLPSEVSRQRVGEAVTKVGKGEFSVKVQRVSKLLRSGGGAERAADLVELYVEVGNHHGIPAFIKYRWNWVQYYNVDVRIVIVVLMVVMVWVSVKLCRCCCRRCCCRSSHKTKQE